MSNLNVCPFGQSSRSLLKAKGAAICSLFILPWCHAKCLGSSLQGLRKVEERTAGGLLPLLKSALEKNNLHDLLSLVKVQRQKSFLLGCLKVPLWKKHCFQKTTTSGRSWPHHHRGRFRPQFACLKRKVSFICAYWSVLNSKEKPASKEIFLRYFEKNVLPYCMAQLYQSGCTHSILWAKQGHL